MESGPPYLSLMFVLSKIFHIFLFFRMNERNNECNGQCLLLKAHVYFRSDNVHRTLNVTGLQSSLLAASYIALIVKTQIS
jgi:hypothetical protein